MLTVRLAAKVPPVSWPGEGWELDPISSKSLTKLPAPNWDAGRFIVVLGLTLFIWAPLTTRFLNADPAALKKELKPEARSEEHTSELQSLTNLVCRLLLEKK